MSNTWYFEKLISTNPCGEQPLGAWAVCNLGALNLSNFVVGGEMDYALLAEHTRVAIRMLDNVVDANYYFYKENEEQQKNIRRTGLGTMGLGDALIKMKIAYGSDTAIPVVEKIYKTIRDAAYDESAEIAREKGPFPKFDKEKYLQGAFIKRLPLEIQEKIAKYGIRSAVLLTQAPTGTTSLVSGASSGIEPVYDFAMVRRDRTGEHILYHPLYEEWRNSVPEGTGKPSYFVSANDLTPEEHVKMQATIQYYTDSSISKTVNAPNAHSVEDVKRLYTMAYDLGCKGVTYMRDGSRAGVLSHIEEKPAEEVKKETVEINAKLRHRPEVLTGYTYRVQTPVGEAFVTINEDPDGNPFEVFINVGKAGSDITADAEAMGRLMSVALRIPSAYSPQQVAEKIAFQLKGIGGSGALGFGASRVRSLADAISKVMYEHIAIKEQKKLEASGQVLAEGNKQSVFVAEAPNGHTNGNGNGNGNGHKLPVPLEKEMEAVGQIALPLPDKAQTDFCPSCGQAKLVYEEGCKKCYACGYSAC
jgi:ribonucleoside-diphosphate reductase alpha chain